MKNDVILGKGIDELSDIIAQNPMSDIDFV